MNDFSNTSNGGFNLKIGEADVGDELKKRRLKLADTKLGPTKIVDQMPEVKEDEDQFSSN